MQKPEYMLRAEKAGEKLREKISSAWLKPYWLETNSISLQSTITHMTTSKIKTIKSKKFNEKYSTWYFQVEMENWDAWSIWKKDENALNVWDELTYTKEEKEYNWNTFTTLKEVRENTWKKWWTPRNYKAESIGFAMSYAKDILCSYNENNLPTNPDFLEKTFEKIYWMMQKKYEELWL